MSAPPFCTHAHTLLHTHKICTHASIHYNVPEYCVAAEAVAAEAAVAAAAEAAAAAAAVAAESCFVLGQMMTSPSLHVPYTE